MIKREHFKVLTVVVFKMSGFTTFLVKGTICSKQKNTLFHTMFPVYLFDRLIDSASHLGTMIFRKIYPPRMRCITSKECYTRLENILSARGATSGCKQ